MIKKFLLIIGVFFLTCGIFLLVSNKKNITEPVEKLFLPEYNEEEISFFEAYQYIVKDSFLNRKNYMEFRFSPMDVYSKKFVNLQYVVDKPSRVQILVLESGTLLLDTVSKFTREPINITIQSNPLTIWGNLSSAFFFNLDRPLYFLISGVDEYIPGWVTHLSLSVLFKMQQMENCTEYPIHGIFDKNCLNKLTKVGKSSFQICLTKTLDISKIYWFNSKSKACQFSELKSNLVYQLPNLAEIIWFDNTPDFDDKAFLKKD